MPKQKKTILLCDRAIAYDLKKSSRAKRMRIAVSAGGVLSVTVPYRFPDMFVERFLHEKAEWILRQMDHMRQRGGLLARYGRAHYFEHKEAARALVHARLAHFNQFYDFDYGAISIRDQKTRWGSCSRSGNLNFNYKLAVVPEHVADYVIVHELCHCKEFNHSKAFWKLVERTVPNHREIRKQLNRL
ncbi:hypothetical protein A2524_01755 [Candidatus Wolfebacteria bacterium RIFOXYD12_FULL_48_21]|uniref:YgjP-like metallopeptidase domain-containing protein n=1 Tax=Candidatus Wolfebacteria bacterium RIFOXYD1_FULL_48_65 TaxID=1802561 RepID=A0A1F8E0W8_9BACT|nr:MAG: hypothetical protein A2610_03730 [Candidatus Wolfebacteria bacterium RIFOXYD1_FULL_48_65]OGM94524.1 MAG: hypothetical protein A2524_01755 [Candidatus Wolfebacteria bacterium RIFOXYD12_FULL_48_21]OGM96190.1 MAG: hypothetical protein A2532_01020 [Candidatus Wolfebacteria bacterium RIFOXYD2_FULL_48_11]